jgi:hypothetical protein
MNRIWDQDQIADLTVGMFPTGQNNYQQDARWVLPADLAPGHICHPEWLATGEPYPNDLPPTVYDPDGWPQCCPRMPAPIAGAAVDTGADHGYPTAPTAGASVDYLLPPRALAVQVGTAVVASGLVKHVQAGAQVDTGADHGYPTAPTVGASVDYVMGGGFWIRTVAGDYVFTALVSGTHIIESTGGAGGGEDPNGGHGGTGGGGGGWARRTVTLTAGDTLNVHVGAGGPNGFGAVPPGDPSTVADLTPFILCQGAGGVSGAGGGAGGAGGLCIGDLVHGGGDGAQNAGDAGGGGGSSGGPTSGGNHGNVPAGGAAVPGGGKGGWATPHSPTQYPEQPGGAGGGGDNSLHTAGDGGRTGQVIIRW